MTGAVRKQVGSWLYMAPEMTSGLRYTEAVDVFSLAIMLFEALSFRLNVMKLAMGGDPEAISQYAEKVALGHREKIPKSWPAEVRSLLEDAWEQVRCCSSFQTSAPQCSRSNGIIVLRGLYLLDHVMALIHCAHVQSHNCCSYRTCHCHDFAGHACSNQYDCVCRNVNNNWHALTTSAGRQAAHHSG